MINLGSGTECGAEWNDASNTGSAHEDPGINYSAKASVAQNETDGQLSYVSLERSIAAGKAHAREILAVEKSLQKRNSNAPWRWNRLRKQWDSAQNIAGR